MVFRQSVDSLINNTFFTGISRRLSFVRESAAFAALDDNSSSVKKIGSVHHFSQADHLSISDKSSSRKSEEDLFRLKAGKENFNVASKLLPKNVREHLINIYRYCRYIDDIGDISSGDRTGNLLLAEEELKRALDGSTDNKVFSSVVATVKKTSASKENLFSLIAANLLDQTKKTYDTFEELCDYCKLSANPVGRLVLSVFGAYNPDTVSASDKICTSLQIIEHLQDVAEDYSTGRIYLPKEDLDKFHVSAEILSGKARTSGAKSKLANIEFTRNNLQDAKEIKRLLSFECGRARQLMIEGSSLVKLLPTMAAKIAISGFIGGGLAQLDAIEKSGYDVLAKEIKASKIGLVVNSLKILAKSYLHNRVSYTTKTDCDPSQKAEIGRYVDELTFLPKSFVSRWLK